MTGDRGRFPFLALLCVLEVGCRTLGGNRPENYGDTYYKVEVVAGDTLAGIAAKYDTTWKAIAADNRLSTQGRLRVGQVLKVRPGAGGRRAGDAARRMDEPDLPARDDGTSPDAPSFQEEDLVEGENGSRSQKIERPRIRRGKGLLFGEGTSRGDGASSRLGGEQAMSDWQWPVRGPVSSFFGPRLGRFHAGLDIRAARGTPVLAAREGRVLFSGGKNGYGQVVILKHLDGYSLYAHCDRRLVGSGATVRRGQPLATVGKSGNARGVHLHFEIHDSEGNPIDPFPLLIPPANEKVAKEGNAPTRDRGGWRVEGPAA